MKLCSNINFNICFLLTYSNNICIENISPKKSICIKFFFFLWFLEELNSILCWSSVNLQNKWKVLRGFQENIHHSDHNAYARDTLRKTSVDHWGCSRHRSTPIGQLGQLTKMTWPVPWTASGHPHNTVEIELNLKQIRTV